jgi:hypothetical protein
LEQQQEHVKATEILVSKERERIEALENALNQREAELPEKHQDLVLLNLFVKIHCFSRISCRVTCWDVSKP